MSWVPLKGYKYLGRNPNICGGRVTLIGSRLEPRYIYYYGQQWYRNDDMDHPMEVYNITAAQYTECILYHESFEGRLVAIKRKLKYWYNSTIASIKERFQL